MDELESIGVCIQDLREKQIESMSNDEKLQFLQTVNFLLQFLMVAKNNTQDKEIKNKIKELPEAVVVSYVNSSATVKSLSDYCCTSANAVKIAQSIPPEKDIFISSRYEFS